MTRDAPPPDDPAPPPPEGTVRPTGPGPLVIIWLIGLALGWSLRGQRIRAGEPAPGVPWLAVGTAFFVAAIVAGIAFLTWRAVHRDRVRLRAQQGVARLVLGKAVARLGAFGIGAYLGVAISYLGVAGEGTLGTVVRALLAAGGAAAALAAGLLLEHACRVPTDEP